MGRTLFLDGGASSDADGDALTYAWTLAAAGPGSQASLASAGAAMATFVPDVPGLYRFRLEVRDSQGSTAATDVEAQVYPAGDPQIVLGAVQPLEGTVRLSVWPPLVDHAYLRWTVNGTSIGNGSGADRGLDWDTSQLPNGTYELVASAYDVRPMFTELHRTVQVFNGALFLSASAQEGTASALEVAVIARSAEGIDSVNVKVDGVDGGTLTAPNAGGAYLFLVNSGLPPGDHTLVVTATDGVATRSITKPVRIVGSTTLAVDSPVDGAFVLDTLSVRGSASTDKAGAILDVRVTQGLEATALPLAGTRFDRSFDWSARPAGMYRLVVEARDGNDYPKMVQRSVVRASSPSLAYSPAVVLPAGGKLLDVEGSKALFQRVVRGGIDAVVIRDLVTGAERSLDGMDAYQIQRASAWQLEADRVYALMAEDTDCDLHDSCVYEWAADGTRTNLTAANPFYAGLTRRPWDPNRGVRDFDGNPVARDGFVLWKAWDQVGGFIVYEVATRTFRHVALPPGVPYLAEFEAAAASGVLHLVYWAEVTGSNQWDVWAWDSAS